MGGKLYVGNLGEDAKGSQLQELFAIHGAVKWADVAVDPASGRCKGFGFVQMVSVEDARKAIAALDNRQFEGRLLKVSEARPKGAAHRPPKNTRPGGPRPLGQRPPGHRHGGPRRAHFRPRRGA